MTDLIDRLRDDARSEWAICNEAANELEHLSAELANARAVDIHSCHAGCTRAGCVNARLREERDALREQLALAETVRAAQVAGLAQGLDALRVDAERYRWLRDDRTEGNTMTTDDIATYRANYDKAAWERITQGWRLHVVPPGAILAINALCDEVERLQAADAGPPTGMDQQIESEGMMNDRKLLELAAKAAGIPLKPDFAERYEYYMADKLMWSPLTDDGDALRLAVQLRLTVNVCESDAMTTCFAEGMVQGEACDFMDDPYAATRRAIVRAAAAIGEQT